MKKLRTAAGIVVRQKVDKTSLVFTNSPDLIVTGTAAAFDPSSIIDPDAYRWYFSQAPVPGSPNFLYIRGLNYSPTGSQRSRVYLYWVSRDDLLDPTRWQSSGFSVDGVPQNYAEISALSQYQYVMTTLMWTPPHAEYPRYFLISWVDNDAQPSPPVWPATPFANLAALGQYVAENPTMAVLDTVYQGAFLRQFPGQTVFQGGTGAKTSPDLIVTGVAAAKNAALFGGQDSYNSGNLSATAALGVRNFVYVRALNATPGPATARVYLYWAPLSNLTPTGWNTSGFTVAGRTQNWVDLTAAAGNDVMVSTVPLVWFAPASQTDLPVLITYVDNTPTPKPPDFSPFGYVNPTTVAKFVASQPRLSWLAITGKAAPVPTMSWNMELAAGTGTNSLYVGVQLTDIPTDGTLSLSVPGPDASSTIVVQSMRVPDPRAYVAWPVTYPDDFRTSAVLTYTAGAQPPGQASIVATMVPRPQQRKR
jgi:hypothetical protein